MMSSVNLMLAAVLGLLGMVSTAVGAGLVFVSSEKDHVVTVFDQDTLDKKTTIATSERPRAMKLDPAHALLYVACGDGDSIDVIDIKKLAVVRKIPIGDDPDRFDISPDGRLLVSCGGGYDPWCDNSIRVWDAGR